MLKPTCIEWNVGRDAHGRDVKLRNEQGKWSLTVEAANQRDDTQIIRDLTGEIITAMAEAVRQMEDR